MLLNTIIELQAVEYNILLNLFPPIEGSTVYFLQLDGQAAPFKLTDDRAGITTGFRIETNKFQQTKELRIATTETDFREVIRKSSHIAIGSTVYSIDKGSIEPPTDEFPYYTIGLESTGDTYTP